jgi:hypothetical protein
LAACALKGSGFTDVVNLRGGFALAQLNGFASHSAGELQIPVLN